MSKLSDIFSSLLFIGLIILILAEILFWLEKKKSLKENHFWFTIKRKLTNIGESAYVVGNVLGAFHLVIKGIPLFSDWLGQYGLFILNFIGWGTLIVLIIIAYIKFNSLKYRRLR